MGSIIGISSNILVLLVLLCISTNSMDVIM